VTTFSIVLFIHVISAMALFVAIALEGAILARMRSAENIDQLRQSVRGSSRLGAIYGPAFVGILLAGIYLAAQLHIRAAWIPLALGATLLIAIIGGIFTARKMSRLRKAAAANGAFEPLAAIARGNTLAVSYGFRAGLAVGIVFLMSATPTLIPSILALAIASILGVSVSLRSKRASGQRDMAIEFRATDHEPRVTSHESRASNHASSQV
jgi:xanthosine utilization system XapX-like protein